MTTPTTADAVRAAIDALRNPTGEEVAAATTRALADALLPRPATSDRSPQADRDRLLLLQFLELANELAGNTLPAASREALAEAREESQAAAWDGIEPEQVLPAIEALAQFVAATESPETPQPWGYAYRYSDGLIRFNNGKDVNGGPPIEAIPIWLGHPPAAAIKPAPPATAPGGLAQWLAAYDEHLQRAKEVGALPGDVSGMASMLADAATLLQQQESKLATAREALRRLVVWGGFLSPSAGYNADVVLSVADWFADGMTGPLPPLPPYIACREGLEPTTSAPALPPAISYGCSDGVVIEAANRERTSWAVRDHLACLNFSGEWEPEPYPSSRDADFLARARWPSAAAAWAALLEYRAGDSAAPTDEEVEADQAAMASQAEYEAMAMAEAKAAYWAAQGGAQS